MTDLMGTNFQVEDTQKDRYLTFNLSDESYGVEIRYVTEIIGVQSITEIPEFPEYAKGIINLRGKIIPVIDVRLRFNKEEKEYNDRTCIIVVDINEVSVGLIVDTVDEVLNIPEEDVENPPIIKGGAENRFVKHIGKIGDKVKLLLDCEKLLTEEDLDTVSQVI